MNLPLAFFLYGRALPSNHPANALEKTTEIKPFLGTLGTGNAFETWSGFGVSKNTKKHISGSPLGTLNRPKSGLGPLPPIDPFLFLGVLTPDFKRKTIWASNLYQFGFDLGCPNPTSRE